MSYRTTCPQCSSVFRLGLDQLEAAQGWVQCSVCGAAFNAYASLLMEDGSPLPAVEEMPPPPPPEPAVPEAEMADAMSDADAIAGPSEATPEPPPLEEEEAIAADTPVGITQRETPAELPSIILIDPDVQVSDEPDTLPQFQPVSSYPHEAASGYPPAPAPPAGLQPSARIEYAAPLPGAARPFQAPRRTRLWVWIVASTLLLAVLLAQSAYFLRDTLVSQLPQSRPLIEQACGVLGCALSLPKNLAQLQIVGSDLQTEESGRLKLVLTLGNRASQVQAWPVLVLTLTDQRNKPLARRSFAPSEYLSDAQRIAAGIPPRSEQALNLPLTVRGLAPMGFDLQLTY